MSLNIILAVAAGGAIGSTLRYLVGLYAQKFAGSGLPYGTLSVNIIGSFLMGAVMAYAIAKGVAQQPHILFLTVGVLGGFTTFSAFSYETMALISKGEIGDAVLYIGMSVLLCLIAAALGLYAFKGGMSG